MNKTLIALAIAAALPVAAQADATLSGSVTSKYIFSASSTTLGANAGSIDTDAAISLAASEVLANGMTAKVSIDVLGTGDQGKASLAGDFGTLTTGKIDSDGAFQAADVAGIVGDTEDADEGATTVSGLHFATTMSGLGLSAQINPGTAADAAIAETRSNQMGVTYDLNGFKVGYGSASADADSTDGPTGVTEAMTVMGVSYTMGDLVVSAGKQTNTTSGATSPETVISATYTMAVDALTVKAQFDNFHSATDKSDYQVDLTYAMSDAISLSSEIDKAKTTTMVASYASGNMTAKVSKTDDGTTDASVALDFGNADLTLARDGGGTGSTNVKHKSVFRL